MREKVSGKMHLKLGSAVLVCLLGISFLAGCSEKKTVEYDMSGNTEDTHTESGGSYGTLEQFADAPGWNDDHWSTTTEEGMQVQMNLENVELVLPEAEEMFVVEVNEPEFDAAYKERVIKKLFTAGEIYDYDTEHMPKKDLLEKRELLQEAYESYEGEDDKGKDRLLEEIQGCDEALNTAGDTYTPTEGFEAGEYLGERGGLSYILSFRDVSEDEWNCRSKEIDFTPKDIYQVCPKEVSEVEGLYYDVVDFGFGTVENECEISEEEACGLADSFVKELGLEYPVRSVVKPLAWWKGRDSYNVEAKYLAHGYVVSYDFGVGDVSFVMQGVQENYGNLKEKSESEKPKYNMNARLDVCVTEKGVIGVQAHNPVEIIGTSKDVKLLSMETVKEIMRKQTKENPELFRFCVPSNVDYGWGLGIKPNKKDWSLGVTYNELSLIYFRVRDKENAGHYSYIPAWRLSDWMVFESYINGFRIDNPVIINAIDGSVIDFYDEI